MTSATTGRPTKGESQRRRRIVQSRASGNVARRQTLPEYLEPSEVHALIEAAPHGDARLLMEIQWRAGLRISEALALEVADLHLAADPPVLRVRQGKGRKDRLVPIHSELLAALDNHICYKRLKSGLLVEVHSSTAWRWYKSALASAQGSGAVAQGRRVATHTLRHSAARHWLASGVPLNRVSVWLGHASLQTTLVYLQILPDPGNDMERVP